MTGRVHKLTLEQWDARYEQLRRGGLREPNYGGPLRRHVTKEQDYRLEQLHFDGSTAVLRLWNFLLTENERLRQARERGEKIVGTMKDLGTVPVMAYSLPGVRAFYPDGAWWTPCLMECSDKLLQAAETMGIDASFCPVRAMLPAFQNGEHFPLPDLLICSAGSVCDDFSAIAQRLEHLGHRILWWEMPRRRLPHAGEACSELPGGLVAPQSQVDCVRSELQRLAQALCQLTGSRPLPGDGHTPSSPRTPLDDTMLSEGIRAANDIRRVLNSLRQTVYSAPAAPLPALEMLIAEMLAIHFCSDRKEALAVLSELLIEAEQRLKEGRFVMTADAVRIFWVNPVADLRAMNLLEALGGRLIGSDFMFTHALDLIPEDLPPLEALARVALADPMVGPATQRAERVVRECRAARAEAVVVSRIPGASHCAREGEVIRELVRRELEIPTVEIEVPSVCDALLPTLEGRLQALMETAKDRRNK